MKWITGKLYRFHSWFETLLLVSSGLISGLIIGIAIGWNAITNWENNYLESEKTLQSFVAVNQGFAETEKKLAEKQKEYTAANQSLAEINQRNAAINHQWVQAEKQWVAEREKLLLQINAYIYAIDGPLGWKEEYQSCQDVRNAQSNVVAVQKDMIAELEFSYNQCDADRQTYFKFFKQLGY